MNMEQLYSRASFDVEPIQMAPLLVHHKNNTMIYRLNDTGFKVILLPNMEENIRRLEHEKKVSNFLPSACPKKQAVDVTSFNGLPALVFKWVHGITLKEWLQQFHEELQVDMNARLRVAMAISKTLHDFHMGGVVHNNLTNENIVLSSLEGEYVATLIGYSNAMVYRKDSSNFDKSMDETRVNELDLKSLGLVLKDLFLEEEFPHAEGAGAGLLNYGEEIVNDEMDHHKQKRGKQPVAVEGFPHYLGTMISALLDSLSDMCYESAQDVFLDLKFLSENSNGSLMARTLDDATINSKLRLSGQAFYGRQVQVSMLDHLIQYTAALGDRPLMATISGYAGTG